MASTNSYGGRNFTKRDVRPRQVRSPAIISSHRRPYHNRGVIPDHPCPADARRRNGNHASQHGGKVKAVRKLSAPFWQLLRNTHYAEESGSRRQEVSRIGCSVCV